MQAFCSTFGNVDAGSPVLLGVGNHPFETRGCPVGLLALGGLHPSGLSPQALHLVASTVMHDLKRNASPVGDEAVGLQSQDLRTGSSPVLPGKPTACILKEVMSCKTSGMQFSSAKPRLKDCTMKDIDFAVCFRLFRGPS